MEWRVTAATGHLEHVDHEQWLDAEEELIEALQAPGLAAMGTAGWGPIGHLGTVFILEAETAGEAAHLGAGLFEKALQEIDVVAALERLEVEPASTDGEELQELEVEHRIRTADSGIFQAMTASEVARLLGVSRQRVYQLMTEHPRFPRPAAETPRGAAWDRAAVEEWVRTWDRKPGRPASLREFWVQVSVKDIDGWSSDRTAHEFKRLLRGSTVIWHADDRRWLLELPNEATSAEEAQKLAVQRVENIMLRVRKHPHLRYEVQPVGATPVRKAE